MSIEINSFIRARSQKTHRDKETGIWKYTTSLWWIPIPTKLARAFDLEKDEKIRISIYRGNELLKIEQTRERLKRLKVRRAFEKKEKFEKKSEGKDVFVRRHSKKDVTEPKLPESISDKKDVREKKISEEEAMKLFGKNE